MHATQAINTSEPERRKEVEVLEAGEPGRVLIDTSRGENLARESPVVVSVHEEEVVVGEEEGTSEVVPTNKPME